MRASVLAKLGFVRVRELTCIPSHPLIDLDEIGFVWEPLNEQMAGGCSCVSAEEEMLMVGAPT